MPPGCLKKLKPAVNADAANGPRATPAATPKRGLAIVPARVYARLARSDFNPKTFGLMPKAEYPAPKYGTTLFPAFTTGRMTFFSTLRTNLEKRLIPTSRIFASLAL